MRSNLVEIKNYIDLKQVTDLLRLNLLHATWQEGWRCKTLNDLFELAAKRKKGKIRKEFAHA